MSIKDYLNSIRSPLESKHVIRKRQTVCACVPVGTCPTPAAAAGMIDIRIVTPVSKWYKR